MFDAFFVLMIRNSLLKKNRCSLDLKELLSSDVIQHVVCGIPYKELRKSRAIYQPGSARKVMPLLHVEADTEGRGGNPPSHALG